MCSLTKSHHNVTFTGLSSGPNPQALNQHVIYPYYIGRCPFPLSYHSWHISHSHLLASFASHCQPLFPHLTVGHNFHFPIFLALKAWPAFWQRCCCPTSSGGLCPSVPVLILKDGPLCKPDPCFTANKGWLKCSASMESALSLYSKTLNLLSQGTTWTSKKCSILSLIRVAYKVSAEKGISYCILNILCTN